MTDERCIDCGLHVFDCECACQECGEFRCTNDHRPDNRTRIESAIHETRNGVTTELSVVTWKTTVDA